MSDSSRHGHPRPERHKSCPDSSTSSTCSSSSSSSSGSAKERSNGGKGTGKRFARRAKRWAELQNRRSAGGCSSRAAVASTESSRICESVELARMGSGILLPEDNSHFHTPLSNRRSLPYSILQPRRHEIQIYYPPYEQQSPTHQQNGSRRHQMNRPYYYGRGVNEYGQHTYISVYQTAPELTVYPVQPRMSSGTKIDRSSIVSSEPSSPDSVDALSLLTADLCATSISSPNSSLSTSLSSQEADEFIPFSHIQPSPYTQAGSSWELSVIISLNLWGYC